MGLFDWIGPTSLTKRRGWDALPVPGSEAKSSWTIDDQRAVVISPLVHGPGASDLAGSWRRADTNSAVFACLEAICSAYVEAPLAVYRQTSPRDREPLFDSPLQAFLDGEMNPELDELELFWWWNWAKHVDGNAYLRKIRAGNELTGNVVELWPISPMRIEPKTEPGSGDLVSFYRYYDRPGHWIDIPRENMIHGRMGLDDRDHRRGCSPLKRLVREVSSDDEATKFADALLRNYAIPGLVVTTGEKNLTQDAADEIKAKVGARYGSDNRGNVGVLTNGSTLTTVGWSPEQLDLKVLHRLPEERIAAVLRVPAIVAGLGAGLDRSTFANYAEANQAFIEQTILTLYRADDRKLTKSLARDFTSDRRVIVAHDVSQMRALQDDEDKKAVRLGVYVDKGILTRDEARAEIGREPLPDQPALPSPTERRSRPRIVTLPLARKSLDDLPERYEELRDDRLPDWEADLRSFLDQQLRRAAAALRAGADTADGLIVEGEATLLGEVLAPLQSALLDDVHGLVVAELGIAFDLDDPATRAYLRAAGSNIVGITDTTRDAVRAALVEGQAAGEGVEQLAARLRSLPAFNDKRARTVARTELGHASNTAALASYRASGVVVGVRVFDGDYDGACQAMNGRVFSLGSEPATLQHPNCRRAFAPIIDAAELERSA